MFMFSLFMGLTLTHVPQAESGTYRTPVGSVELPLCEDTSTVTSDVDPCASSPCVSGVCTNLPDGQFKCTCTEGWQGTLCDTGFLCGDGQNTCMPFSVVCNHSNECTNHFDESQCCGDYHSHFQCGAPSYCITWSGMCDGDEDCVSTLLDETVYCQNTCTITAPTRSPDESSSPVVTEPTTKACRTTTTPWSTTQCTTGATPTKSPNQQTTSAMLTAAVQQVEKGFFDDPTNIALMSAAGGVLAIGGLVTAVYTLNGPLCKEWEKRRSDI